MAYDANARSVVLFGGHSGRERLNDTWTWDGRRWTQHSPSASPTSVNRAAMAYDPKTRRVLLFTTDRGTWLWDGVQRSWEKQNPAVSPPSRIRPMMATDPATQTIVMFGGAERDDTWIWDGATKRWIEATAGTRPPGRSDAGMAYDPVTKKIMLFGGYGNQGSLGDTWTFDGLTRTWTQAHPITSPPRQWGMAMSNDDVRNQVVLFSGWAAFTGEPLVWAWNGSNWVPQPPGPTPRAYASMAYDAARQQVVLFGGNWWGRVALNCGILCGEPLNDTWTYGVEGAGGGVADDLSGVFHPLSSARIFGPVALGETSSVDVQVTGTGGVPTTGVSAVALSITVANPSQASFLTVWPTGSTRPTTSALNWTAGETVANAVQVKLGTGGKMSLYNQWGTAPVTVDVVGWYTDETATSGGGRYNALAPKRILDTRGEDANGDGVPEPLGAPIAALAASSGCASPLQLQVAGAGGVPAADVSAVVVNLTVTPKVPGPTESAPTTGSGALVAWPTGEAVPTGSNVPYDLSRDARRTIPTLAVTKLGTGGKLSVCNRAAAGTWPMHAVADVVGWYSATANSGARFVPLTPARLLDTRPPCVSGRGCNPPQVLQEGATATPIAESSTTELQVTGRAGVPHGASAVVLNVTATEPTRHSFLTVWPTSPDPVARSTGSERPVVSNLNYVPGQTVPNLVVVKVGDGGKVSLYNRWGSVHVVADVVGWFTN